MHYGVSCDVQIQPNFSIPSNVALQPELNHIQNCILHEFIFNEQIVIKLFIYNYFDFHNHVLQPLEENID